MDIITTCPAFSDLDQEIIKDFSECLRENIDAIESCINLLDTENDPELIHRLFRDMHSFKGNCRMVELDPVTKPFMHLKSLYQKCVKEQEYITASMAIFSCPLYYVSKQ